MDRAVAALGICADKLRRRNVSIARSVATEACRRAANGREFVDRVRSETGIVLDIIPPQEEARLAVLGCHKLLEPGGGPALIFDIGGGSTELVLVEHGEDAPRIRAWWSAPWGVVSLTESEGREAIEGDDRLAAYGRMRERAPPQLRALRRDAARGRARHPPARHQRDRHDARQRPPRAAQLRSARGRRPARAGRRHAADLDDDRGDGFRRPVGLPCIGAERADLVVAGCAILEAILDIWPAEKLGIADRGIREGILRSLMARDGMSCDRDRDDQRVKTAKGRKVSSTRWLERQLNDPYVKRAKADGYRSRAAYKLIELDEKFGLLKGVKGGRRPRHRAGRLEPGRPPPRARRRIAGIDLLPTDPIEGVEILEMDFMDEAAPAKLRDALGVDAPTW